MIVAACFCLPRSRDSYAFGPAHYFQAQQPIKRVFLTHTNHAGLSLGLGRGGGGKSPPMAGEKISRSRDETPCSWLNITTWFRAGTNNNRNCASTYTRTPDTAGDHLLRSFVRRHRCHIHTAAEQLLRVSWVGAIRCEATREEIVGVFSR